MSQLIIIRGNSGSGKSIIAKELRKKFPGQKVAVIGQDYLRRHILGETGKGGNDNVELIELTAQFSLGKNYITILEGIMPAEYYAEMLKRLSNANPYSTHHFYLDIPFEETVRRHQTKPERTDFAEEQMREWYREKDLLNIENEQIIPEHSTLEASVAFIITTINKDKVKFDKN